MKPRLVLCNGEKMEKGFPMSLRAMQSRPSSRSKNVIQSHQQNHIGTVSCKLLEQDDPAADALVEDMVRSQLEQNFAFSSYLAHNLTKRISRKSWRHQVRQTHQVSSLSLAWGAECWECSEGFDRIACRCGPCTLGSPTNKLPRTSNAKSAMSLSFLESCGFQAELRP